MLPKNNRITIVYSTKLTPNQRKIIGRKYSKIPSNWRKRFEKDGWQMLFTSQQMKNSREDHAITVFQLDYVKKQIWVFIDFEKQFCCYLYESFARYILCEYGDVSQYETFQRLYNREEKELKRLMEKEGYETFSMRDIFCVLFAFVIQTNCVNPKKELIYSYSYTRKWITEEIFCTNLVSLPSYMEVGKEVIRDQIILVEQAFHVLPEKIRKEFQERGWKIRISRESILETTEEEEVVGFCSGSESRIKLKSSQSEIGMSLLHEFGHFIYSYLSGHKKRKIRRLYATERNSFLSVYHDKHAIVSDKEYFAELFAQSLLKPMLCQQFVKKSYEYMKKIMEEWK